jgi:hypothetical protein
MFESILSQVTEYDPDVLESLIDLTVEIAREGRAGMCVGTLFTFGDEKAGLAKARPLISKGLLLTTPASALNAFRCRRRHV